MSDAASPESDTPADIIVEAFGKRYLAAYAKVAELEGGFVDDPRDKGGATKYGVSLRFLVSEGRIDLDGDGFADFDLDMDGDIDVADIRKLTPADARYLFQRCFWNRMDCESFAKPIGEAMFDQGVNGGIGAARKLLQIAIVRVTGWPLEIDGRIGPATRARMAAVLARPTGMETLIAAYRLAAADRYREIARRVPSQKRFLKGWLARADRLGRA